MELNDKWKKVMNKAGVSQKELEDNIIIKTRKEINKEIIEATNVILNRKENNASR
jgi:hypothetical protein